jgi:acyl-CoA synthetase (AMP-forming)/AMP-acid ligase II
MIVRSGFNLYPSEVENAIAAFPDVAQWSGSRPTSCPVRSA